MLWVFPSYNADPLKVANGKKKRDFQMILRRKKNCRKNFDFSYDFFFHKII